ncbi:metal ABC transporter solute-binding protein, Zn/Mn family [Arthrobacter glacialis]|uniref:ABC transporter substrate-binding protein n=1 Tax=Arthrobacter glacialis TaxID=1664 RepID=A0A2S3ZZ67_ARTGL|nr:zinc ABC transporter substrate-binding protein [Arthrobacter glacialis]POH59900.1 ABC transporter substrate-binding protein [Arthrobacter glacialis]POH74530.1 ABC transporter substrate-binding protein [Arthrobacter glacialis]
MSFRRRSLLFMGATLGATLTLAACGGGGEPSQVPEGTVSVVASTNVYADIAQAVGGEQVTVHSIISKAGADPHGYEANAQDKLAVSKAQIGIENGGGYDDFFDQLAKGQLETGQIINVSELSGLDMGPGFNEHLWYSLPVMSKVVDEMAARFGAALPEQASTFTARAADYKAKLQDLDARLAQLKKTHDGTPVAITEPVPLYLLEQAGLVNETPEKFSEAVENGTDAAASTVTEMKTLLTGGTLAFLAYNEQTQSPQTEQLKADAQTAGLPVVDFSETLPAETSYLDWMVGNVSSLEQALASGAAK